MWSDSSTVPYISTVCRLTDGCKQFYSTIGTKNISTALRVSNPTTPVHFHIMQVSEDGKQKIAFFNPTITHSVVQVTEILNPSTGIKIFEWQIVCAYIYLTTHYKIRTRMFGFHNMPVACATYGKKYTDIS